MPATDEQSRNDAKAPLGWLLGLLAVVALALGAGIYAARQGGAVEKTSGPSVGGPFTLADRHGQRFTQANLAGKPFAIFFGFTRCPDVCPTNLARMARLRQQLGKDGDKFAIVFVSVDPGHDKPADVGNYVDLFGTPIIGLTGSPAQLAAMEKAYAVYVAKVPQPGGDYTIDHTAATYLMDARGHFVDLLDHQELDQAALAKLRRLIG